MKGGLVIWINMEMIHLMNNMNKWIVLLVAYCTCVLTYSQSISVKSCTLAEEDNTAKSVDTQVLDQNGERCALLKIRTTETGFSFDVGSLGIIKTMEQPNEIWLYVPYGIKKMSINHPKYENLKDYQFPVSIRSGKTYIMSLSITRSFAPNTGGLDVTVSIDSAKVYLDGQYIGTTPLSKNDVAIGQHNIILKSKGYSLYNNEVLIGNQQQFSLNVALNRNNLIPMGLINAVQCCTNTFDFIGNRAVIIKDSDERLNELFKPISFIPIFGIIDKQGHFYKPFAKDYELYYSEDNKQYVTDINNKLFKIISWKQHEAKAGVITNDGRFVVTDVDFYEENKVRYENTQEYMKESIDNFVEFAKSSSGYECSFYEYDGMYKARSDGKIGYIKDFPISEKDKDEIFRYEDGHSFVDGLAAVKINGKWGYINKHCNIKIDCIYDDVYSFSEGYAFVKSNRKWAFIDKNGKLQTPFIYDEVRSFSDGMAAVRIGDWWGYVNKYGNDTF